MIDTSKLSDAQLLLILQSRVLEHESKISRHHKVLIDGEGDRHLPLVERVRNLEAFQGTLRFWLRTVAVAIVLQTITFASAAVIYFIKLYPVLQQIADQP